MPMAPEMNQLAVHGLRVVAELPPHFEVVIFDLKVAAKNVTDWIHENLEGRFWFGEYLKLDIDGELSMSRAVAFEVHAEASIFLLSLDQVNSYEC
jgi:hypothetical protein